MFPAKISKMIYWSLQPLRGRNDLARRLSVLEETQWFSQGELQEFSFRKLESLLKHSYETVPYYRELMDRHGFNVGKFQSPSDILRLPVLTRDNLEKNFGKLKSTNIGDYKAHESCSSGSTGQPARFMQDANYDIWCRAHQLRTYNWCGDWNVGEKFALVWGSPVYWDKQTYARRAEAFFTNRIELNCNNVGEENLRSILKRLVEFKPKLISGYSTALYLITQLAKRENIRIEGLRALQPNAEPTYDYMMEEMEQHFKVPVYDKYGSTETNIISHQSLGNKDAMCMQTENTHVEFMNEKDEYCGYGESGNLIVTTLNNYSMPLIRYQTSDVATPLEGKCPSGRGFPLMSKVRGRLHDLIITKYEERVHPQVFSNLFSNFISVLWFQVVQNEIETLDIHLLMREAPSKDLENTFLKMINLRTGGDFKARFHHLTEMPSTKTGKHKLCVCNIGKVNSCAA